MRRFRYSSDWAVLGFWAMFLLGLFFAFFLVNSMRDYFSRQAGILSDFYLRQIKYREFSGRLLFPYFLGKRMKWAALFLGLCFFHITLPVMLTFAVWMGFSFGLLMGIGVLKFGVTGIAVSILMILPQGILYLFGALTLFLAVQEWESVAGYWQAFPAKRLFLGIVIIFLGILTESYVNPLCLKLIFRLI